MRRTLFSLVLVATTSACFAVTDLDRFQKAGVTADYQDLVFTFRGATSHVAGMFELRVIDANNIVQMRGVYQPMGTPDTTVHIPKAVPRVNGPYRLDFYGDKNGSGGWDGLDTLPADHHDHGWRIAPLVSSVPGGDPNIITIAYDHNTSFTELFDWPAGTRNPPRDPGFGALLHFKNLDAYAGKLVQLRIADQSNGRTTGLYRMPNVAVPTADGAIGGIVDPEVTYDVFVYADANGNGIYDDPRQPGGDHGWKIPVTSTAQALTFTFDPTTLPDHSVDVGPP